MSTDNEVLWHVTKHWFYMEPEDHDFPDGNQVMVVMHRPVKQWTFRSFKLARNFHPAKQTEARRCVYQLFRGAWRTESVK